jgi:hypothetical protein
MTTISQLVAAAAAALLLAGCATVRDWLPTLPGAIGVRLSGGEQVPPLRVDGRGSGSFRVADDGTLTGSITTRDVEGTMAHIHHGPKGINGPVIVPLNKDGDTYSVPAGHRLTSEQVEELKNGNMYVNVHTARNKAGEIRGQLLR